MAAPTTAAARAPTATRSVPIMIVFPLAGLGIAKASTRDVQELPLESLPSEGGCRYTYLAWAAEPAALTPIAMAMTASIEKIVFLIAYPPIHRLSMERGMDAP
jgi:hypothetical protein